MGLDYKGTRWEENIIKIVYNTISTKNAEKASFKTSCKCAVEYPKDKKRCVCDLYYKAFFEPESFFDISTHISLVVTFPEQYDEINNDEIQNIIAPATRKFSYIVGQMTALAYGNPFLINPNIDNLEITEK